jgi:hypothetical protein
MAPDQRLCAVLEAAHRPEVHEEEGQRDEHVQAQQRTTTETRRAAWDPCGRVDGERDPPECTEAGADQRAVLRDGQERGGQAREGGRDEEAKARLLTQLVRRPHEPDTRRSEREAHQPGHVDRRHQREADHPGTEERGQRQR